jgi:D-alanyl-lipoteichoic acid acyltransferase DltB (MBOAT superfamily)
MLFNSFPFIFFFLPVTVVIFFWTARRSHLLAAAWLTLASLCFYAWWNYVFLALLGASIAFNFMLGVGIARATAAGTARRARGLLAFALFVNLAGLAYFKYANFFLDNVSAVVGVRWSIDTVVLPLGISFFTFTQIAFLVDAYRGRVTSYHPVHYALFVTYFPHLIAGPILHHRDMIAQFNRREIYRLDPENVAVGVTIFSIGLFKKVAIADTMALFSSPVFGAAASGHAVSFVAAWGGVLAYTFQLYFDFSGYCDMAIGISRLFGIQLPLNFNSPYKATSVIDFWRRWHMTLSQFLRDYLYIPLGGSRGRPARHHVNLMITMLLGGLWHGAGWTFVVWGALHGVYLVVNHAWRMRRPRTTTHGAVRCHIGRHASRALTFVTVVIGWVFFRAESIADASRILAGMSGATGFRTPAYFADAVDSMPLIRVLRDLGLPAPPAGVLLIVLSGLLALVWLAPNTQQIMGSYSRALDPYPDAAGEPRRGRLRWRPVPAAAIAIGLMFFASLLGLITDSPSEFLYFQF